MHMHKLLQKLAILIVGLGISFASLAAEYTFGVVPHVSPRVLFGNYQPLAEFIEGTLDKQLEMVSAPSFKAFGQKTLENEYNIVVTAPNLARLAELDSGWIPLAVFEPKIKALFITRTINKDMPISDLEGKNLAVANPQSLVVLAGMRWLAENNLYPNKNFNVIKAANQDSLAQLILTDQAVAAMLSIGEYKQISEEKRQQTPVHTVFAKLPGFVVMVRKDFPEADREKLAKALPGFSDSDLGKAFGGNTGFKGIHAAQPDDLTPVDPFIDQTRITVTSK